MVNARPHLHPSARRAAVRRPDHVREAARRLKREGKTVIQIASELGIPNATVGDWTKGIEATRPCRLCGTPFEVEQSRRWYCSYFCRKKWSRLYGGKAAA